MKRFSILLLLTLLYSPLFAGGVTEGQEPSASGSGTLLVTDALGRDVQVPRDPDYIICSGPGALRLATYLQVEDRVIAVDNMEGRQPAFDARPYALAHPAYRDLPVFGEFRGFDNPELILGLEPQPQVIFKTYPSMGYDPLELEQKTGIPVVSLSYGDLVDHREDFYQSLRTMAEVLSCQKRAEEVITFIETAILDIQSRSSHVAAADRPTCYVGGIAYKGPHGMQSTEPVYPPFYFLHAHNVAFDPSISRQFQSYSEISKEKLIEWDPDVLFIDISTIQSDDAAGALYGLSHEHIYSYLSAVQSNEVYGLLPYNWYTQNFGSILADSYFVGSILYPEEFADMDPVLKADEIYEFLVGKPVYAELNAAFNGQGFSKIKL